MIGQQIWERRTPDDDVVSRLVESIGCSRVTAAVLANRGISSPGNAEQFLQPSLDSLHDPRLLPDVSVASGRIEEALADDETITVVGHHDLDGSAATAVLLSILADLGATVGYDIPSRADGYGLTTAVVEELAARATDLAVTVDCGTTNDDGIAAAATAGIDVVVTDHHPVEDSPPADALACVNPRRPDSDYPHDGLAGAAIAYKLGEVLATSRTRAFRSAFRDTALPLAALATLSDRVPLLDENRAIVHAGYERIGASERTGLREATDRSDIRSIRDLAWSLNPLLNAAKADQAPDTLLRLLLIDDRTQVQDVLSRLEQLRTKRQARRRDAVAHLRECLARHEVTDSDPLIMVETERFVDTVAASRVAEEWGKPLITLRRTHDGYQAWGQSPLEIDFRALYEACDDLVDNLRGHPGSAGCRIERGDIEAFRRRLFDALSTLYAPEELRPRLEIDTAVAPEDITPTLCTELERLQPFGRGNDPPLLLLEEVSIGDIRRFGDDDRHVKLLPNDPGGWSALAWNQAEQLQHLTVPCTCDIVGELVWDHYDEAPAIQLTDLKA